MVPDKIGLVVLGAAAATTLGVCLNAHRIGTRLAVMAEPDDYRKLHNRATPQIGGLAILSGLAVWIAAMLLTHDAPDRNLLYAIGLAAVGVGVVGFADDQRGLTPGARILLLLVFVGAAFVLDKDLVSLKLNWGSFEPTSIPLWAYVPLMALTAGGVVNAVNMADGQDGVAGGMFVAWSGCLALVTGGGGRRSRASYSSSPSYSCCSICGENCFWGIAAPMASPLYSACSSHWRMPADRSRWRPSSFGSSFRSPIACGY